MNVKPGDLAYIVGASKLAGRIVEVISRAPIGVDFALPDGYTQSAQRYEWVIHFVGAPVEAPTGVGSRMTNYGCAPDSKLRPISGVPLNDETPIETNIPEAMKLALGIEMRAWA
ncbi:hypothetical protein B0G84_2351 [Paraburkholderia sp. BL8N3]|nr:hypothetical protein [Paraburkholderia sp. BL8N3]TCK44003.1 hypothetical protein B0G84_2351 [Paraburkholderia sp. BL8N3]